LERRRIKSIRGRCLMQVVCKKVFSLLDVEPGPEM
jgi:hypothetical protein